MYQRGYASIFQFNDGCVGITTKTRIITLQDVHTVPWGSRQWPIKLNSYDHPKSAEPDNRQRYSGRPERTIGF